MNYLARVTPRAMNDFLALPFGRTKRVLRQLFGGAHPATVDAELEDIPGPGTERYLRVNEVVVEYRPVIAGESGRPPCKILVTRIFPLSDLWRT